MIEPKVGTDLSHERAVKELLRSEVERLRSTVGARYNRAASQRGRRTRWGMAAYARMHGIVPAWGGERDLAWREGAGSGESIEAIAADEAKAWDGYHERPDEALIQVARDGTLWDAARQRYNGTIVLAGTTSENEADALNRFLSYVVRLGECAVWRGGSKFRVDADIRGTSGLRTPARFAYEQRTGRRLPQRTAIGQRCGNRWCVAAAHLYEYPNRPGVTFDHPIAPSGTFRAVIPAWLLGANARGTGVVTHIR